MSYYAQWNKAVGTTHIIPVKDDMANLLANSCLFINSADTEQN